MTRWNRTEVETLISLYESQPFLYDTKHEDYHNRSKRDNVITEIAEKINEIRANKLTMHDVKSKIKTLRTQYAAEKLHMAEKLREASSVPREDGVMEMYIPRLWCYGSLKFLDDYAKEKTDDASGTEGVQQKPKKYVPKFPPRSPVIEKCPPTTSSFTTVIDREDVFANFVAHELKQITDFKIFQETKWKIQLALKEGIEKQMEINADGFITEVLME